MTPLSPGKFIHLRRIKPLRLVLFGLLSAGLRQVFTRRGLEKTPTLDVKLALEDRPGSGYGVHRPGLSEEEAGLVAGLLGRVRLFAATEGLIVKVTKRWVGS